METSCNTISIGNRFFMDMPYDLVLIIENKKKEITRKNEERKQR